MSADVIALRPTQSEVEAAWAAFVEARNKADSIEIETRARFDAEMEAVRAHKRFFQLAKRWDMPS